MRKVIPVGSRCFLIECHLEKIMKFRDGTWNTSIQPLTWCYHHLNNFTQGKHGFAGCEQIPPNSPSQCMQHKTSTSCHMQAGSIAFYSEQHCCS